MLKNKLVKIITNENNCISLDKYIEICLFDKNGYYKNINPIGKDGDFITAPEISQLFGEIIGIYIYNKWSRDIKKKFNLIELGPGKGTLTLDILRITNSLETFRNKFDLYLIEINNYLKKIQKKSIKKSYFDINKIKWYSNLKQIKSYSSIIYANEFFDCFPVKQFIKINNSWNEKKVSFNKKENKFIIKNYKIEDKSLQKKLDKYIKKYFYEKNCIIELSESREKYFKELCRIIKKNKGFIIIFDYGYENSINYSSLQSIKYHKYTNILDNPGKQDISSFVNFTRLKEIAVKEKLEISYFDTQKNFLISNGIIQRKEKIALKCSKKQIQVLENGLKRITEKNGMGELFKCLIVSSKN